VHILRSEVAEIAEEYNQQQEEEQKAVATFIKHVAVAEQHYQQQEEKQQAAALAFVFLAWCAHLEPSFK
jgi:GH24 family phage-related lysozyme (muramidase)